MRNLVEALRESLLLLVEEIGILFLAGAAWTLSLILILPLPSATWALYRTAARLREGEGLSLRAYLRTWRELRPAWLRTAPLLLIPVVIAVDVRFYSAWAPWVAGVGLGLTLLWAGTAFWALPAMATRDLPLGAALRSGFLLALARPGHTLFWLALLLGSLALLIRFWLFLLLPLWGAWGALCGVTGLEAVLETLPPEEGSD